MRITLQTDYALRVLIYLETHRGELVTTGDIATSYNISQHHLVKVVHRLAEEDLIDSVRGRNGGIRLTREASTINIGEVFRRFESESGLIECFDPGSNTCPIEKVCTLKHVLKKAQAAFLAELDRYTLADLVKSAPKYLELFFSSE